MLRADAGTETRDRSIAIYERSRRLANRAMWTISLQRRRLKTEEPEDDQFIFRKFADFEFLIVALWRLRRAAELASTIPTLNSVMVVAVQSFDASLPSLKTMRNVAEHIDEYAIGKGRDSSVQTQSLEVGALGDSDFEWLDRQLNADVANSAAQKLFAEIQQAALLLTSNRTREI